MGNLKTYQHFINESNSGRIINVILDTLEPSILDLVNKTEAYYLEKSDMVFTSYDRELTRLNIIFDMVKSIEKYTLPSDSLISISASHSRKGNLEISAQIQRDGIAYSLSTEVIIAGGFNIQIAHYRYITSTDLPITGQTADTKEYGDKIKKLTKLEKLNKEVEINNRQIEKNLEIISINSKFNDEEIWQKYLEGDGSLKNKPHSEWPTWDVILGRGAAGNYNDDENFFNAEREKSKQYNISHWKYMNIKSLQQWIDVISKNNAKIQNKIEQAINSI